MKSNFFFNSSRKLREAHPEVPQPSTSRRRSPIKGATSASYDHDLFEQKLQQAKNDITRQKDDELAKMHIQIRKEMDDKLRIERNRYEREKKLNISDHITLQKKEIYA